MFLPINHEGDSYKFILVYFKAPVTGQKPSNKNTKMSPSMC